MKVASQRIAGAICALLGGTAMTQAGGIERATFNPAFLFEPGNYAEFSFGTVAPSVSGSVLGTPSGDMADSYSMVAGAAKMQMGEQLSLGLVVDQPVGANVTYPSNSFYPFKGSNAEIKSTQLSALALYRLSPNTSVYGGLRAERASGVAEVTIGGPPSYVLNKTTSTGYGYVLGAAYEKPEIALRVALSYVSAIDHDFSGNDSYGPVDFTTTVPQALRLDFQTGVAANTLVFGSVAWRDWSEFNIIPRDPATIDPRSELSSDNTDTVSYSLGIGRKFTDQLSGAVSLGYEAPSGEIAGNLSPTDGYKSITLAAVYTMPDGPKISVGATYGLLGDAKTQIGPFQSSFTDNHVVGVGVKVGFAF